MKKLIFGLLILILLIPRVCYAQSIFPDFVWRHSEDMSIFWVLTDPNGRKYKGNCDVALTEDPNVYCQEHMQEWLDEIYEMNTDPNIPDWEDTHSGQVKNVVNALYDPNVDTPEELKWFIYKDMIKTYKLMID